MYLQLSVSGSLKPMRRPSMKQPLRRKSKMLNWFHCETSLRPCTRKRLLTHTLKSVPSMLMLCAASMLSGCTQSPFSDMWSTPLSAPPTLDDPPAWMLAGCPELQTIDKSVLTQKEVEDWWTSDAESYHACRLQYRALRNFYKKRDAALRKQ